MCKLQMAQKCQQRCCSARMAMTTSITLPYSAIDHPDWTFDLSCDGHGHPVGLQTETAVPHGHKVHYIQAFKLHCSDGSITPWTEHRDRDGATDGDWIFTDNEPIHRMTGCTNKPSGHDTTYWASGATFWSKSGSQQHGILPTDTSHSGCADHGGSNYDGIMTCPDEQIMQRFQGTFDQPKGHSQPYIATLRITCVDQASGAQQGTAVLV